jgi:hypothetical protein
VIALVGRSSAAVNGGIEGRAGMGRCRGARGGNRFALARISLALDEVDATEVLRCHRPRSALTGPSTTMAAAMVGAYVSAETPLGDLRDYTVFLAMGPTGQAAGATRPNIGLGDRYLLRRLRLRRAGCRYRRAGLGGGGGGRRAASGVFCCVLWVSVSLPQPAPISTTNATKPARRRTDRHPEACA